MSDKIQRHNWDGIIASCWKDIEGKWVRYDDHLATIKALQEENTDKTRTCFEMLAKLEALQEENDRLLKNLKFEETENNRLAADVRNLETEKRLAQLKQYKAEGGKGYDPAIEALTNKQEE